MKRRFLKFGILILISGIFLAPHVVYAQQRNTSQPTAGQIAGQAALMAAGPLGMIASGAVTGVNEALNWVAAGLFKGIGYVLMTISGLILTLVGMLFDTVVNHTILNMGVNLKNDGGIGTSISVAWATLRDIANMVFIFILLYAAFRAMFDSNFSNFGTVVKNIIIVALLINFSLFFSKVVVDASNIVAIGFYRSIASSADLQVNTTGPDGTTTTSFSGISAGYMNMLGLQSWYSPNLLTNGNMSSSQIIIVGVMSSIFFLITAVIFLITAVMFTARYIIIIFLLILSPLAFVAYAIPKFSGRFWEWFQALVNQAFFAPIFFALTWVVFKLGSNPNFLGGLKPPPGTDYTGMVTKLDTSVAALVLNYVLIIGFSIAALILSKKIASKDMVGQAFSNITGAMGANKMPSVVGGVAFGGAAAVGRGTVGVAASRLAQSQALDRWAGRSWIGQKAKEGVERTAKSSFDVRQTRAGQATLEATQLGNFGKGKAGGYDATLAAQIAKKEKVSAGLKTDAAKQAYAQRTMGATGQLGRLTRWYKIGGSRAGHRPSLFGTMGRSHRVVASRIFNNQIQPLRTQLDTLNNNLQNQQNRDTALNQQLNTAQGNLIALQNMPQANRPANYQQQINNFQNNINNIQNQIAQNQQNMTNTQNQINAVQPMVQNLQNQINNLGLTNTAQANPAPLTPQQQIANAAAQAAGQPLPHPPRGQRADEQNY